MTVIINKTDETIFATFIKDGVTVQYNIPPGRQNIADGATLVDQNPNLITDPDPSNPTVWALTTIRELMVVFNGAVQTNDVVTVVEGNYVLYVVDSNPSIVNKFGIEMRIASGDPTYLSIISVAISVLDVGVFSTSANGLVPASAGHETHFLRGDHTWVAVTGGSGGATLWSDITSKPTTLSGFGITDGITATAVVSGYQPLSANLGTIGGLTATTDSFLQAKAGAWSTRTIAQVKTDLGVTGSNTGDQTITLSGAVTGTGTGAIVTSLAAGIVALANLAQMPTLTVIGNGTGGNAVPTALTGANLNTLLPVFTTSLNGSVPASGGGTSHFLRADGTWVGPNWELILAASDETTALAPANSTVSFRVPRAITLSSITACLSTAGTGGTLVQIDVKKNGTTVFSTKPSFNSGSDTTVGGTTPGVLSVTSLAANDKITVDIIAVGSTIAGAGLKISLIGNYA
jgi:hypothetical protein